MKSPAFQFYPSDWLSSTNITLMTPAQEGAYIRLLCHAWNDPDCSIPDDDAALAVLTRLFEGWFDGGSAIVRKNFEPHPEIPGRLVNARLLLERKKQDAWREKSRTGGIRSGESRTKAQLKGGSKIVEPKGNISSSSSSSIKDNTVDKSTDVPSASSTPADQVFDHWKTSLNHPRSILDAKRRRLINERLKEGFSVEDLKSAIDGCKQSPFHQGENDRRQVYDDISLICRDASKVEQFIACRVGLNGNGSTEKPKREYTGLTWATMTEEQRASFRN